MDERRKNSRGRVLYELRQSIIATLSVAISWGILFTVSNITMSADMNYRFLFRMLAFLLILVMIFSYMISIIFDKISKYLRSRKNNK